MPRDKAGNSLTWKEFFARWKKGIEGITPVQQAKVSYQSTYIIIIGILAGLLASLFNIRAMWWLAIILTGALINTVILQIGNYQKYVTLKRLFADIDNKDKEEMYDEQESFI